MNSDRGPFPKIEFPPISGVSTPYQAFVPTREGDERCCFLIYQQPDHSDEPIRCQRGTDYEIPTWNFDGWSGWHDANGQVHSALTLCGEHLEAGKSFYQRGKRYAGRPLEVRELGTCWSCA